MSIYEKLLAIQNKLICSKAQYNSFGKYKYRSCEDILEAVKPLLLEQSAVINICDTLENIGERYYVKATASIIDIENGDKIFSTAYAREEDEKKGMDGSQITGAASSYARKYALNGLLAIDDVKDSDSTNTHGREKTKRSISPTTEENIMIVATANGLTMEQAREWITKKFGKSNFAELTTDEYGELIRAMEISV